MKRLRRSRFAPTLRGLRARYRVAVRVLGIDRGTDAALRLLRAPLRPETPRVSVIVATIGRSTLNRTLQSASWASEVIVVYDAAEVPPDAPNAAVVESTGPTHNWGAEQRAHGMRRASGTHLAFIDDDDVYTPDAGAVVTRALLARPSRVHIFKMRNGKREYGGRGCVWDGGIGTPMFVVPNDGRVGEWSTRRAGDYDFIRSTLALRREGPRFHDEVVAEVRPDGDGGWSRTTASS